MDGPNRGPTGAMPRSSGRMTGWVSSTKTADSGSVGAPIVDLDTPPAPSRRARTNLTAHGGGRSDMSPDGFDQRTFGLVAFGMVVVGGLVMLGLRTGSVITDLGLVFAGGCFASGWIAFALWRGEVSL